MIWRNLRNRHVSAAALTQAYFDRETAAALPDGAENHIRECDHCARRLDDVAVFLDGVTDLADRATQEALTPDHLATQRQRIMHRLGTMFGSERPARVLRFPSFGRPAPAVTGRARWLVATMAAGLLVGVVTGQVVDFRSHIDSLRSPALARSTGTTEQAAAATNTAWRAGADTVPLTSEEAILVEIDAALNADSVAGLQAIDALTPRVREIALTGR